MSVPIEPPSDRKSGKVVRVLPGYGFISCEDVPDEEIYFKTSWFRGSSPLREGELVTFQHKIFEANHQAHYVDRAGEFKKDTLPPRLPQVGTRIIHWAWLGYLPNVLAELAALALKERWEFMEAPPDPEYPLPILRSYLFHTFGRLVLEEKIVINERGSLAAFNTGLVDPRYEPIYALFTPNDHPRTPWQLAGFCIAGEGANGQNLVRHFNPLPAPAHYFDNPLDLLYDVRSGKPELDWKHIIIQRIDRYPTEFVEDHWPPDFEAKDTTELTGVERKEYFRSLGAAIEEDSRTYRRIMNRVKDAIDLSIKRITWNFKTAIPTYYPEVRRLQLLLPVCLVSDDQVDLALAVEKTPSGSYLGHTTLPLDWAYKNARLVCRPDSDWLVPAEINAGPIEEDETE